mmetsp:Transcript_20248/g.33213  ORF Transcript_20248/g.33213 Transcript_20248/m.33213 type:complete len:88 (-) Transcript_20248:91-354(-)
MSCKNRSKKDKKARSKPCTHLAGLPGVRFSPHSSSPSREGNGSSSAAVPSLLAHLLLFLDRPSRRMLRRVDRRVDHSDRWISTRDGM